MDDKSNYVKIHEAVQAFCEWSLPSIEACIRQWHQMKQGTLSPCHQPIVCPSNKKPTARSNACQSCIAWGSAVEGECYPPGRGVQWKNVNATFLNKAAVEVAKGFVFILPHAQSCASFDDFDVGGILKMMIGFKSYHNSDQACVNKIQKVVDIRNNLSHMKLSQQMRIPAAETSDYFLNIKDIITDLAARHARLNANTIISLLDKIQTSKVTVEQIKEATKPLTDGLRQTLLEALQQQTQDLKQCFAKHNSDIEQLIKDGNKEGAKALQNQTDELQNQFDKLSQDIKLVAEKSDLTDERIQGAMEQVLEELKMIKDGNTAGAEQTKELQHQVDKISQDIRLMIEEVSRLKLEQAQNMKAQQREEADKFDLAMCQEELREFYLDKMGKVQLFPRVPEEIKDMESIFVDLELEEKEQSPASPSKQKLERNEDLVTLKIGQGQRANRVLLFGDAGSGKSTIAANIAYKWALNDPQSPLHKFALVFLINMVDIEEGNASLVDLIFDKILAEDSQISREGLKTYIASDAKDILIMCDGLDEYHSGSLKNKSNEITKVLQNRKLRQSCVILLTRPHKKSELGECLPLYKQVQLTGFSSQNMLKYIRNFFKGDPKKADTLVQKLQQEPHILALAGIPVLLLMICLLWADQCSMPRTKTQLYRKTVCYIWKRYQHKHNIESSSDEESDHDEIGEELDDLLNKLGEAAFHGFTPDQMQIVFSEKDFGTDICRLGCEVGLISREAMRKHLKRISQVKFLHLSFQEFCIAVHFTHLMRQTITQGGSTDKLIKRIFYVTEEGKLFYPQILDFCCGLEPEITYLIIKFCIRHAITTGIVDGKSVTSFNVHLTHIFESQLSHDKCLELGQLFSGLLMSLIINYNMIPSVLYLLQLFKSTPVEKGMFAIFKWLAIETGFHPFIPQLLSQAINIECCVIGIHKNPKTTTKDLEQMYKELSQLRHLRSLHLHNKILNDKLDITNLLAMLTQLNVRLITVKFTGLQYDINTMGRFLSNLGGSIEKLQLSGTLNTQGKHTSAHEILKVFPNMKVLTHVDLMSYQIGSAVKKLRPIISGLMTLGLHHCDLRAYHLKELFMILSKAMKLQKLDLSGNMFTVTSVDNLLDCLRHLPVLDVLVLMNTGLTDETASNLAECLKEKSSIQSVELAHNPGIGPKGRAALQGLPVSYSMLPSPFEFIVL